MQEYASNKRILVTRLKEKGPLDSETCVKLATLNRFCKKLKKSLPETFKTETPSRSGLPSQGVHSPQTSLSDDHLIAV